MDTTRTIGLVEASWVIWATERFLLEKLVGLTGETALGGIGDTMGVVKKSSVGETAEVSGLSTGKPLIFEIGEGMGISGEDEATGAAIGEFTGTAIIGEGTGIFEFGEFVEAIVDGEVVEITGIGEGTGILAVGDFAEIAVDGENLGVRGIGEITKILGVGEFNGTSFVEETIGISEVGEFTVIATRECSIGSGAIGDSIGIAVVGEWTGNTNVGEVVGIGWMLLKFSVEKSIGNENVGELNEIGGAGGFVGALGTSELKLVTDARG